jgi:spermidine synthase
MALLLPLFLVSGIPALLYQVVWQRSLFTIYGTNTESATAVVAAFLLGLGIGAFAGGWVANRSPNRLLFIYGLIEFCIGIFGIFSLSLFDAVGVRFTTASMAQTGSLAFALVVLPTVLMGATLPILAAYLVAKRGHVGNGVGALYFVNTLGSAFACFFAAEVLMQALGQHGTIQVAAGLNLFVGVGAILLSRMSIAAVDEESVIGREIKFDHQAVFLPLGPARAALLAGLTGYLSLSFEMLWFRSYAFLSGGSARDFAHLLGFFLLGIAFGGLAGRPLSRLADRSPEHGRTVPTVLLLVAALAALLCIPAMSLIGDGTPSWVALPGVAIVAGLWAALFPVIAHLSVAPDRSAGSSIGQLYLANVVGSVAGCLLTGFVMMDYLTTGQLVMLLCVIGIVIAWTLWIDAESKPRMTSAAVVAGLAIVVGAAAGPLYKDIYERLLFRGTVDEPFVNEVETKAGVIGVLPDGVIFGSGVYDGRMSVDFIDDQNGIFRAFSISAFHPNPKRVLMIGLSGGAWAQVVGNHPQVEELTVVEINPGYLQLIPRYPVVASLLENPRIKIVLDDGRRWIRNHKGEKFDVVVMNTTFHWRSFASNVLSREFLDLVNSVLNPGGVVMFNATGSSEVQRTAAFSFADSMRFATLAVGSNAPIVIDTDRWESVMQGYAIDGAPVVSDDDAGRDALDRNHARLRAIDEAGADAGEWDSIERKDFILKRTEGQRVITDDNMGLEWKKGH